jgi:truncated hemoglobin YjbI
MKKAHEGKNITLEAFGAVAEILQRTLTDMGVSEDLVNEVMTIAASTQDDVVSA